MNCCGPVNPTMTAIIGEVTEGDTSDVKVRNEGTPSNGVFVFDFELQKGIPGDKGAQGVGIQSISIEEVNTG